MVQEPMNEPMKVTVKHTFVDMPATRPLSLEGFLQEREVRSCPASRMVSLEDEPESFSFPIAPQSSIWAPNPMCSAPRDGTVDSLEEFFMDRESMSAMIVQPSMPPMTPKFMVRVIPQWIRSRSSSWTASHRQDCQVCQGCPGCQ